MAVVKPLSPAMRHALLIEIRALPTFTTLGNRRAGTIRALERRGLVDRLHLTERGILTARRLQAEP